MKTIDLKPFKSSATTVFTGRPQGQQVREKLNLESIDKSNEAVEIIIPEDTTSFNPSFFLGLLFGSIKNLGPQKFKDKYHLKISTQDSELYHVIDKNVQDGLRNAINTINSKTGLNSMFNF